MPTKKLLSDEIQSALCAFKDYAIHSDGRGKLYGLLELALPHVQVGEAIERLTNKDVISVVRFGDGTWSAWNPTDPAVDGPTLLSALEAAEAAI